MISITFFENKFKRKTEKVFCLITETFDSRWGIPPPPDLPIDGYILMTESEEFKYKIPTIDVVVDSRGLGFIRGETRAVANLTIPAKPGDIVEITRLRNEWVPLRIRKDRRVASDSEEYSVFEKELEFFKSL